MADFTHDGAAPVQAPAQNKVASAANWAGAAVSLALVVGVGVWGYKLLVRDVTGVPVVQAMEGPMRIAPEDPGGTLADHQGLAVNDVAGTGTATPVPDRLLLAPQRTTLAEEDLPAASLPVSPASPAARSDNRVSSAAALTLADEDAALAEAQTLAAADPDADPIQALADKIAAGAAPLSELAPSQEADVLSSLSESDLEALAALMAAEQEEPDNLLEKAAAVVPEGALLRSLRPQLRPTSLPTGPAAAAARLAEEPPAAAGPTDIDPASLPAGTRLAQLGAYDSPATARSEWDRFAARFGDFMEGKDRVIERASSGGRIFYRLRAHGFEDISDARRFCAAFVAENADCIPVTTR